VTTAPVVGEQDTGSGSGTRLPGSYWRQLSASAISNLGDGMTLAAMPLLALTLTDDARLIAAVSMASFLPWLFLSLPAGVFIDRHDRRHVMIAANVLRGLLYAGIAVSAATGTLVMWLLLLVLLAVGICEVLFDNAAQAFLPAIVPAALLPKANGRLYAAEVVTNTFLGLPFGSWLFVLAIGIPFGVNAATFLVAALLVLTIRVPRQRLSTDTVDEGADTPSYWTDLVEGLRWLWAHRFLRSLALLLGATNLGAQVGIAIFVKFAADELGVGPRGYGLLLAAMSLGAILGGLVGDRIAKRLGTSVALIGSYLVFGLTEFVIFALPLIAVVTAVSILQALASTLWNVVTVSLRQQLIPSELFGRVNSVYRWLGWGTIPIGAMIGGLVAYNVSIRAPFFVGGSITMVALALFGRELTPKRVDAALSAAGLAPAGGR
jgi:MFS family permease